MDPNIFIARMARGAVASTLAACLVPPTHTEGATVTSVLPHEDIFSGLTAMPERGTQEGSEKPIFVTLPEAPRDWDKGLEREFRELALCEAKGTITAAQSGRLEELNRLRNIRLHPQPPEAILKQIRRDRLVARMEQLLDDYVEFKETSSHARDCA
jgi:hypothetical protein